MLLKSALLVLFLSFTSIAVSGAQLWEPLKDADSASALARFLDELEPDAWADTGENIIASITDDLPLAVQSRMLISALLLRFYASGNAALDDDSVGKLLALADRFESAMHQQRRYDYQLNLIVSELRNLADRFSQPEISHGPGEWQRFKQLLADAESDIKDAQSSAASKPTGLLGMAVALMTAQNNHHRSERLYHGTIPALLERLEESEAAKLIDRALAVRVEWTLSDHPDTARLARQRAIAGIANMQVPVWRWVGDGEIGEELYTALLDRFGQPVDDAHGMSNWSFQEASSRALVQRGLAGDTEGVMQIAGMLDWEDSIYLPLWNLTRDLSKRIALFDALLAVQQHYPEAELWDDLRVLGAESGRGEVLVQAARQLVETAPAGPARISAQSVFARSLLADDQVDEAIPLLVDNLSAASTGERALDAVMDDVVFVLRLGALLGDAELIETALQGFFRIMDEGIRTAEHLPVYRVQNVISALSWYDEAAPMESMDAWLASIPKVNRPQAPGDFRRNDLQTLHRLRIDINAHLGNHAKVLQLASEFPGWPADDIGGLIAEGSRQNRPVLFSSYPLLLANSLYENGSTEEVPAIVRALLPRYLGEDPVYALFLKSVSAEEAFAFLKTLQSIDAFQERPLIWKARLHYDAGRLADAREAVQRAIAIDPSDGEQGRGTRMHAYSLLGKIAAAEGEVEEADFLEGVVAAIRLSEDADRFWDAGLLNQALELYRESLGLFADAYCIQSRLAIRFAEQGLMDEAREHYRKAYELMPDSFGRIESHCFGCEGAFRGEVAQGIAEEVFLSMLEARPEQPQVHYLLGYLRENQGEKVLAADHYRKTVELDPLYYNAWARLLGLRTDIQMSNEEQAEVFMQLVALDPALIHLTSRGHWQLVNDPIRLWQIGSEKISWGSVFLELPSSPDFPAATRERASAARRGSSEMFMTQSSQDYPVMGPGDYLIRLPAGESAAKLFALLVGR